MIKKKKVRAKAKPMRAPKRVVAKELPPYPKDEAAAQSEFLLLQMALLAGESARAKEAAAKAMKDEFFETAKLYAERLRKYVEANGITPAVNKDAIAFADGTYALEQSSRQSAFLTGDKKDFVAEARKKEVFDLFVRVKEEPDMVTFLHGDNRLKASKFESAKIEHARSVVIRPKNSKAKLLCVLNEREPKWVIEFPEK